MAFSSGFVGVHIGAGQHSESRTPHYLHICACACKAAVEVLKRGGGALEAAAEATRVMEDEGDTNAGYGSNLTEFGTVEMDAGIMDGASLLFGAVGAMPGIKNPILVAKMLVQEQEKGMLPLGRVPPGFLVGLGAKEWAVRHGMEATSQKSLVSDKAFKLYKHYKKKLDAFRDALLTKSKAREADMLTHQQQQQGNDVLASPDSSSSPHNSWAPPAAKRKRDAAELAAADSNNVDHHHPLDDRVTDTVGVVVLDSTGNVASTVSSGGIALKQPGRVGQASCFGCGCWAQKAMAPHGATVGVSTTGCGEHLVRTFLARECALCLGQTEDASIDTLANVIKEKFVESEFLRNIPDKLGGAICLRHDPVSGQGEFMWTHTTASLGVAFMSTTDTEAKTRMSRLSQVPEKGSCRIMVEGAPFNTCIKEDSPVSSVEAVVEINSLNISNNGAGNGTAAAAPMQQ